MAYVDIAHVSSNFQVVQRSLHYSGMDDEPSSSEAGDLCTGLVNSFGRGVSCQHLTRALRVFVQNTHDLLADLFHELFSSGFCPRHPGTDQPDPKAFGETWTLECNYAI